MSASPLPLYTKLSEQLRRHWLHILDDEKHGVLTFPPEAVDQIAHTIFSNLSQGGFATFVVSGRRSWDPQSYYFEAARLAARRGCTIQRAFLLPHRQYRKDEMLHLHWRLDMDAGIDVKLLYVGDLLPTLLVSPPFGLDFGLWDDQLVCTSVSQSTTGDGRLSEWRISLRKEDVMLAQALRDELLTKASILPAPGTESDLLDLEEPMVQTAPLMDLLSNAVCSGSYINAEDCSWYHGVWQYLRIFDLVSTPTWHQNFYNTHLAQLAQEHPNSKVLISGTADYSVLAHVLWAFDSVGNPCDITVLDLCQTPLILCKWYGRRTNHNIATVQTSIFDFNPGETYDAIVTDAFLTRFSKAERSAVVALWVRSLRPGGCVITTVRVGSAPTIEKVIARPDQVDLFRSRALEQAKRWQDFLPIPPEEIAIKAQRYAERMVSQPITSPDEIKAEFEQQGFIFRRFELAEVKGEMAPTTYIEMVAIKSPIT